MDNVRRRGRNDKSASHDPRQSTTHASEEGVVEVDLDSVKSHENYILKQVKKFVPKKFSSKVDQLVVDRQQKKALFKASNNPYNKCDEQYNRKSSSIDKALDPPSTHFDVPGSMEQIYNTDSCTQESTAERVLTNPEYNIQEDKCRSKDTSGKSHNSRSHNGKQENKGIRVQNNYLEKNDTYGSLDRRGVCSDYASAFPNISGISVSIAGKNSSEDSSYSDDVTQSGNISRHNGSVQSSTLQGYSSSGCTIESGNISPQNVPVQRSNLQGYSSSGCTIGSGNISPQNVPAQKSNLQEENPSSGYTIQTINVSPDNVLVPSSILQGYFSSSHTTKYRNVPFDNVSANSSNLQEYYPSSDFTIKSRKINCQNASFEGNNLTTVLAANACSEQSGKHINASKKSSSNGKSQIKKNSELEVLDKVETVPSTSVVLQSAPSNIGNPSYPPTDMGDWDVVETEPPFLDSSSHHDLQNVQLENVHLDYFENQSSSILREEQAIEHNLFVAKGNIFADRLRNLPEKQSNEAEKQISYILFKLEAEARQKKPQEGNLHQSYPYTRQPLSRMCKEQVSPSQKSPSPRKEEEVRVRKEVRVPSPNLQRLYPQLPQEELNGDTEEQENTEPWAYDQNSRRPYDPKPEDLSDEQESEEEPEKQVPEVTVNPLHLLKKVNFVPEKKWPGSRRKTAQRPKEKASSPTPPPSYTYMKKVLCALLVIICAVAAVIFGGPFWPKILEMLMLIIGNAPPQMGVASIVENLKRDFGEQPPMTYKIVNNALRKVTEPNPKAPAIIVLLAELGAEEIAGQFASKIAKSVASSGDSVLIISGHTYRSEDHDVAKKEIDNLIKENLKESELGAVLVERLDYIPADAAMIFHTYCDHENAPFKRAVYVMTIASKKTQLQLYEPKDWDTMVQDHLHESWSTGGNDQISSLLSRLTVSVAAIVSGG